MSAIDIAPTFIGFAAEVERKEKDGIQYSVASALELPFESQQFDFATAVMSLMDLPDPERALAEVYRVLRPGGFLQFSILHPCVSPPWRLLRTHEGKAYAVEVGRYRPLVYSQARQRKRKRD